MYAKVYGYHLNKVNTWSVEGNQNAVEPDKALRGSINIIPLAAAW